MHHYRRLKFIIFILVFSVLSYGVYLQRESVTKSFSRFYYEPQTPVFSEKTMLEHLWRDYKAEYISDDFRTLDKDNNSITTSEGQSYSMLRAVWQDDKETFDSVWKWTKDILWKDDNRLFAWLFGEREDGTYGVIEERGGWTSAVDADIDIAMALLFAYSRWQEDVYLLESTSIIKAIWNEVVVEINGKPYLVANDLEQYANDYVLINPSYFSPAAFRMFAEVDLENDWLALVDTSYEVIQNSGRKNFDTISVNLPPDWIALDRETGELVDPQTLDGRYTENINTNFSFDAMRVVWRVAIDLEWYESIQARQTLERYTFLYEMWDRYSLIHASYTHSGEILYNTESLAMYGTALPYFMYNHPDHAKDIYQQKLVPMYIRDQYGEQKKMSYYDSNWMWFGMAFYQGSLENYFEMVTREDLNKTYERTQTGNNDDIPVGIETP